ncbi:MAG: hypothetical protein C0614_13035 [Desulfuromonas sp.]|nr:MAG: hypothetical protein C0614_13035 [Desulfuromonas sp.]
MHCLMVLLLSCLLLAGCSTGKGGVQTGSVQQKVGMHIDALLGFAIEYPLDWPKERLLDRADDRGRVIWRDPGNEQITFLVGSAPRKVLPGELERAIDRLPGFEATLREGVALPAGQAEHLIGYTSSAVHNLWLLYSATHSFLIHFQSPPELFDQWLSSQDDIIESLVILEPDYAPPATD